MFDICACLDFLNICPGSLANAIRLVGWPRHFNLSLSLLPFQHVCGVSANTFANTIVTLRTSLSGGARLALHLPS